MRADRRGGGTLEGAAACTSFTLSTDLLLGVPIVGARASDLIAEAVVAVDKRSINGWRRRPR